MSASATHQLSILVIEDDVIDRRQMERLLVGSSASPYDLAFADRLDRALALLAEREFDILLLDLNLPDSRGLETLSIMEREHPDLPKVVVTGGDDAEVGLEAVAGGAQDYLVKGRFNARALARVVQYSIERKRSETMLRQSRLVQSEKLAAIGQLAAGVAHEMNTPVGFVACNFETLEGYMKKIRGLLEAYDGLLQQVEATGESGLRETVRQIQGLKARIRLDFILKDLDTLFEDSREGLERVTDIIRNLRDFARADRAGDFGAHDINEGIKATLTVARNEIKYDAEVKTEFGEIPSIVCNAGQLNQVVLNLLINAVQAIRAQERQTKGSITVRTYATAANVVCEIEDDGPGIPAAHLRKIFDPFFTTKPPGKGTGLGLSVSYDIIVNKHHGQITVESEENRGTKFTVRLPLTPTARTGERPEEALTGVQNNGPTTDTIVCG